MNEAFESFLNDVKQLGLRWEIDTANSIRTDILANVSDHESAAEPGKWRIESFCPITALCYLTTGKYFSPEDMLPASDILGLSDEVRTRAIYAADGLAPYLSNNKYFRKRMIDVLVGGSCDND